jgi:hypothetical protein
MKKNILTSYFTLMLMAGLLLFSSCNDDDEVQPVSLQVQLRYPSDFATQQVGQGIEVTLRSSTGSAELTATSDASGNASFATVIPGDYEITASQTLSAAEALNITGKFNEDISLNASLTAVVEPSPAEGQQFELELSGLPAGNLVFKEVYYTGVPDFYFSDQFYEIYNNSDEDIYLDGLCIADIYGASGQINPSTTPTAFSNDTDHVYASSVWRIPGSGQEHLLRSGESIIIAQDGIDHTAENENTTVNLSDADWETYNERDDNRDVDAPGVPNLERVYFTGGFDWLVPVFGPAVVLFRTDDFNSLEQVPIPDLPDFFAPRVKIPKELLIDTFEALRDAESGSFKRIPAGVDAGFVFATDTYVGESFVRKLAFVREGRVILQDTNNSGNDFEKLSTPTPRVLPQ